jgi:flagellar assembly protein FliH
MDTSFHIRPFAFDQVFEAIGTAPPPLAPDDDIDMALRVAALEAELALARHGFNEELARARTDGFEAGLTHARTERDAALLMAADGLHAAIEGMDAQLDQAAAELAHEAAAVAHAAAEQLAARALAEMPGAAIDEAIGRVLRQVARGQEIQVAVAPELVAEMDRLVAVRQSGDRRRLAITVMADATLQPGDAHIHWDQGGVILDAAARAAVVREALEALLPIAA